MISNLSRAASIRYWEKFAYHHYLRACEFMQVREMVRISVDKQIDCIWII